MRSWTVTLFLLLLLAPCLLHAGAWEGKVVGVISIPDVLRYIMALKEESSRTNSQTEQKMAAP